jgi:gluconokinase
LPDYRVIVLMGVAGTGKTTIGRLLAQALGWPFFDGDDFHPRTNIEKMAAGEPLTDADRRPWLQALCALIEQQLREGKTAVVACSALKASYRTQLLPPDPRVALVHLTGSYSLLQERLQQRRGHFFDANLLSDQLATLEPPSESLTIDVRLSPADIVAHICQHLDLNTVCE